MSRPVDLYHPVPCMKFTHTRLFIPGAESKYEYIGTDIIVTATVSQDAEYDILSSGIDLSRYIFRACCIFDKEENNGIWEMEINISDYSVISPYMIKISDFDNSHINLK